MTEVDIYAVGLLADLRRFVHSPEPLGARWRRLRFDLRQSVLVRARHRQWRALKSYFNGYLAEHESRGTRCGHGWTRGRAYNDLMRHLA
ncbi:MAG TPA: hypothetical protein VIP77_16055 [Jiangellaceae bacterium]